MELITRDKYEGCDPEIAEALKAGLQVECEEGVIVDYISFGHGSPYKLLDWNGVVSNTRTVTPKRKQTDRELMQQWAKDNPEVPVRSGASIHAAHVWAYDDQNPMYYMVWDGVWVPLIETLR
ncbi:MAG: hypothetical protein GY941_22510 [Planctomycetes bacterium]|nr:hypothetical protein [Planctomycetota bacterium]